MAFVLSACRSEVPSKESHRPAWCPRTDPNDPAPCIRMDTRDECERYYQAASAECVPLYTFACYESLLVNDREYCYPTLSACDRDRDRAIASMLTQHRERVGPCTLYRVHR